MEYISVKEAAKLWGIDTSRVGRLARAGRINGAKIVGRNWLIPKNAEKPEDGRTKAAKTEIKDDYFRFPLYVNGTEDDFTPELSEEEKTLRQAELDFLACKFNTAKPVFERLVKSAESIYSRQMSLFFLCLMSAVDENGKDFTALYANFELSLKETASHKKETELLSPLLFVCLMLYAKAAEKFRIDTDYDYSPTVYPIMTHISFIWVNAEENTRLMNLYEIEIKQMLKDKYYFEAQLLHISLFIFHYVKANKKQSVYHLKSAVEIAYKHNFIYNIADAYPYYKTAFNKVLEEYPREFADKVKHFGLRIYKSFSAFTKKHNAGDIFSLLSDNDIIYVLYASQGYSYKQVAGIINVSERTVANRYAEIYDKLGVDGKRGLLEIIKMH